MAISDTLKQKAGPLPVWAWGAILGVIVVAASYWYSSRSSAKGAETAGELVAYPDLDGASGGGGGGGGTVVTDANGGSSGTKEFTSNAAWMTYVVAQLVKDGKNPLTTQIALSNYLSGNELSEEQQAIVNEAISRFGLPPNGVDAIPNLVKVPAKAVAAKADDVLRSTSGAVVGSASNAVKTGTMTGAVWTEGNVIAAQQQAATTGGGFSQWMDNGKPVANNNLVNAQVLNETNQRVAAAYKYQMANGSTMASYSDYQRDEIARLKAGGYL